LNKPLIGNNILSLNLSFNKNGGSSPPSGVNYKYRAIEYTPNETGWYKVILGEYTNFITKEKNIINSSFGNKSTIAIYPNKNVNSYV
jgi:hypothetical protein